MNAKGRSTRKKWTAAQRLAELRAIAKERGGQVLSSAYLGDAEKLELRCGPGHRWWVAPTKLKQGRWCPECARAEAGLKRRAEARQRLEGIAAERGGTLVTPYERASAKLELRCANGHTWKTTGASVLNGSWCPRCANASRSVGRCSDAFERLKKAAAEHGWQVLSTRYLGSKNAHRFRCAAGHTWETAATNVVSGSSCQACSRAALLRGMQATAARHGGACLSRTAGNTLTPLSFRCAAGHVWKTMPTVIRRGIWCPRCNSAGRGNLERMRRIAAERGGKCLSRRYLDAGTKLRWRCAHAHEWDAPAASVIQGFWCRECNRGQGRSRRRLSIETMHEMAEQRGGECLSSTYDGIYGKLRWRCASGHEWTTAANNVRRGGWCPTCVHSMRGTLDGMKGLAAQRGGRCLTRTWNNHREPLSFECARGHRFEAPANVVKSGVWCPRCARADVGRDL